MNKILSEDATDNILKDARTSLNRFGWCAINKGDAISINAIPRPGKAIRYRNTNYKISERSKDSAIEALEAEFGDRIDINAADGIIRFVDQRFFKGKLFVPESFEELMSLFDGQKSFYRGQSNSMWHLCPTIYRNDNPRHEHKFYYQAITQKPNEFLTDLSAFDILVRMQHYEIPTRLIDITTSPLTALHFVLQDPNPTGIIFKFKPKKELVKRFDSLSIALISNLVKFEHEIKRTKFDWEISREFPKIFFDYEKIMKTISDAYFVKPRWNNPRIALQKGAFIICGTDTDFHEKESFHKAHKCTKINEIERNSDKIFITKAVKKQAKAILKNLSFGFSDVYPDLNGIAKNIDANVGFEN